MASAADMALLSDAAYAGPDGAPNPELTPGWTWVGQSTPAGGAQGSVNGYFGAAYQNNVSGEIVVANRGSRATVAGLKEDWGGSDVAIMRQSPDHIPAAFDDAENFARKVQLENPDQQVQFTGHSLGGGEAQVQAARLDKGSGAVTFAAPGVKFAVKADEAAAAEPHVVNYVLPGDPVPLSGEHIGQVVMLTAGKATVLKNLAAIGAGLLIGGPLGLLVAAVGIAATHMLGNYRSAIENSSSGGGAGGGRPQARIGDMHVCPMFTGLVPHVGGPMALGCPTVLVGGMPAARIGDMAVCVGPPDVVAMGSATVLIGGVPAARCGDMTGHGGAIAVGYPTVLTGG